MNNLFLEGKDPLAVLDMSNKQNDIYDEAYEEASQEQQQVAGNQEDVKQSDSNANPEE